MSFTVLVPACSNLCQSSDKMEWICNSKCGQTSCHAWTSCGAEAHSHCNLDCLIKYAPPSPSCGGACADSSSDSDKCSLQGGGREEMTCEYYNACYQAYYNDYVMFQMTNECVIAFNKNEKTQSASPWYPMITAVAAPTTTTTVTTTTATTTTMQECLDTDNGAHDPYGDTCEDYENSPAWCGNYDDDDFKSEEMCCVCGGGDLRRRLAKILNDDFGAEAATTTTTTTTTTLLV